MAHAVINDDYEEEEEDERLADVGGRSVGGGGGYAFNNAGVAGNGGNAGRLSSIQDSQSPSALRDGGDRYGKGFKQSTILRSDAI